jgi:hypothetical protein
MRETAGADFADAGIGQVPWATCIFGRALHPPEHGYIPIAVATPKYALCHLEFPNVAMKRASGEISRVAAGLLNKSIKHPIERAG